MVHKTKTVDQRVDDISALIHHRIIQQHNLIQPGTEYRLASTSSITTMGRIVGSVMFQICCHRFAPSNAADSFNAGSTFVMAARKIIML